MQEVKAIYALKKTPILNYSQIHLLIFTFMHIEGSMYPLSLWNIPFSKSHEVLWLKKLALKDTW